MISESISIQLPMTYLLVALSHSLNQSAIVASESELLLVGTTQNRQVSIGKETEKTNFAKKHWLKRFASKNSRQQPSAWLKESPMDL